MSDPQNGAVVLTGSITIDGIAAARSELLAALQARPQLLLDLSGLTDVDVTFLQLIEAARISARRRGKPVRIVGPAAGAVLTALRRAGLVESFDQAAFWFPGPSFWFQGAEAA